MPAQLREIVLIISHRMGQVHEIVQIHGVVLRLTIVHLEGALVS